MDILEPIFVILIFVVEFFVYKKIEERIDDIKYEKRGTF